MKNKTIIAIVFCLGLAITAYNNNENINPVYAVNASDKTPMTEESLCLNEDITEINLSDQNVNTMIILEVLRNYSDSRMEEAITITFDEQVFKEKTTFQVLIELSDLLNELKNAEMVEIIEEDLGFVVLKLKKDDLEYKLNIYFTEFSQKILKMEYSKLD